MVHSTAGGIGIFIIYVIMIHSFVVMRNELYNLHFAMVPHSMVKTGLMCAI